MFSATEQPPVNTTDSAISRSRIRTTAALILSGLSLITSAFSLAAWQTSESEREQVESRLVCLEQPGPNDCGLDGE
jgi:hypothetical protein